MKRTHLLSSLLVLMALAFGAPAEAKLKKGQKFPDFKMKYLGKKKTFPLSKLKGKVVIVDFWASWCTPCKVELPFIDELYKKHKKKGLVVLGINVDEEAKSAKDFIKEHPVSFPLVYDKGRKLAEKAELPTMPSSFILDHKGVIRYIHYGFHKENMGKFRKQVKTLLKKRNKK